MHLDFQHTPCIYHETGFVRDILNQHGVVAPHTGEPFSEAMLFGIAGGLGAGYFLCGGSAGKFLQIFGSQHGFSLRQDFCATLAERLGGAIAVKETGSARAAQAHLREELEEGEPVLVWVARGLLPQHCIVERQSCMSTYHLLVCGLDEDAGEVQVFDRAAEPYTLPTETLAEARDGICTHKNRSLVFTPPAKKIAHFKDAILAGMRDCWQGMLEPKMGSLGLSGFEKWLGLFANGKNKDGWLKALARGGPLYDALKSIYFCVETSGTGGGLYRTMQADFLDEAAPVLKSKSVPALAACYRELASQWTDFAGAALPDGVPLFRETKERLVEMQQLFEQGPAALDDMRKVNQRLNDLGTEADKDFPLDAAAVQAHLEELRDRLAVLIAAEREAAEELQKLAP